MAIEAQRTASSYIFLILFCCECYEVKVWFSVRERTNGNFVNCGIWDLTDKQDSSSTLVNRKGQSCCGRRRKVCYKWEWALALGHLRFMITWKSRKLGIVLYIAFLANYQPYQDFEGSFYFVIASFSSGSYYPIMQFVSFMMLRWENFQPQQLKRSLWLAFCGAFTCFVLSKQGSRQVNCFPDELWNNWTDPWVSSGKTQVTVCSSMHIFLRSHCKGLCSCGMIPQFILNRGGWVNSSSKQPVPELDQVCLFGTKTCHCPGDTQQFCFHLICYHYRPEMEPFSPEHNVPA